jgi:hypothetical protein
VYSGGIDVSQTFHKTLRTDNSRLYRMHFAFSGLRCKDLHIDLYIYIYIYIYIRLKIKPNSVRIRFQSCQICVLPSTGFKPTNRRGLYFSPQKRLKHGRQNIRLHWINDIIWDNKCIFTKLNAVFILKKAEWTKKIIHML